LYCLYSKEIVDKNSNESGLGNPEPSAPLFRDLNDPEEANPYQVIYEWKGINPTRIHMTLIMRLTHYTIRRTKSNDFIHYIETAAQANPTGESYWKDIKVLNLPNLQARDC